jgi:hypothetical protein
MVFTELDRSAASCSDTDSSISVLHCFTLQMRIDLYICFLFALGLELSVACTSSCVRHVQLGWGTMLQDGRLRDRILMTQPLTEISTRNIL